METTHVNKRFCSGIFIIVGMMFCGCSQDFIKQTEYQIKKYKEEKIAPHYQKTKTANTGIAADCSPIHRWVMEESKKNTN